MHVKDSEKEGWAVSDMSQWETLFGLSSGPLITVLHEHTWQHMD